MERRGYGDCVEQDGGGKKNEKKNAADLPEGRPSFPESAANRIGKSMTDHGRGHGLSHEKE